MSLRLSEARQGACACNVAAAISEYGICIRVPSVKAKWMTQAKKTFGHSTEESNSGEADSSLIHRDVGILPAILHSSLFTLLRCFLDGLVVARQRCKRRKLGSTVPHRHLRMPLRNVMR